MAESVAQALISDDPVTSKAARAALRAAGRDVVTATGKELERILARGDERSRLGAVEAIHDVPEVWYDSGAYETVITALANAIEDGGKVGTRAQQAHLKILTAMAGGSIPENDRDAREEDDRDVRVSRASASLGARIGSVATQIWVLFIYVFLGIAAIAAFAQGLDPLLVIVGFVAPFPLFVLIDSFKRRCRSCRRLLAAQRVRTVKTNYGHKTSWRCVYCGEGWRTERIS